MTDVIGIAVTQDMGGLGDWQVDLARDIASDHNVDLTDIERTLSDGRFSVRVDADLSQNAIDSIRSVIEVHLPQNAEHVTE